MTFRQLIPPFILEKYRTEERSGLLQGAALFVDTSGFTQLTARLQAHGTAGAETLAEILQLIFKPLIAAVYAEGGFVVGFAGDAFKAVFIAENARIYPHALRAAAAVLDHISRHPSVKTDFGTFHFAVRGSLAVGDIEWAIWENGQAAGSSPPQQQAAYTFGGDALNSAIRGESLASAGELILSQPFYAALSSDYDAGIRTHPLLDPGYLRADIDSARSILTSFTPPIKVRQTSTPSDTDNPFVPQDLLTQRAQGEFRPVLTLFINLERLPDPRENHPFFGRFFERLARYGGYLCRLGRIGANDQGGTFLLFWGAPVSHENDAERILNFVLDLRRVSEIPFRAGITRQVAYAGFVGAEQSEEYTCYGLSVNFAARLMVGAPMGEIWVDQATMQRTTSRFLFEPKEGQRFKGFAEVLPFHRLIGQRESTAAQPYATPLIGREREKERLVFILDQLLSRQFNGVVTLSGEAGIGKSRLVYEAISTHPAAKEAKQLYCPTDEIIRDPFNPFRHLLHDYFGQSTQAAPETNKKRFQTILAELRAQIDPHPLSASLERTESILGELIGLRWENSLFEQLDPNLRQENRIEALKSLILAESRLQPVIIQLEDAHWLDDSSSLFFEELLRSLDDQPILLLMTTRQAELPFSVDQPNLSRQIHLAALDHLEIDQLIRTFTASPPSPELTELLLARTGGNPFFVEQLTLYLQENRLLQPSPSGLSAEAGDSALPQDAQAVLIARIDRLTQAVREVVQTAAVLGREFEIELLAYLLHHAPDLRQKIDRAAEAAIWSALSELRYLFKHALLRDAAYEMQLQNRRQTLHRLAGEALETLHAGALSPVYADLFYHYGRAKNREKEGHYAAEAGRQAAAQYANEDAIRYFARALELIPAAEQRRRYQIRLEKEKVYAYLPDNEARLVNIKALHRLAKELGPYEVGEVSNREASYWWSIGELTQAVEAAKRAFEAESGAPAVVISALNNWGYALMRQGEFKPAEEKLREAEALAAANRLHTLQASALEHLSELLSRQGQQAEGREYALKANAIAAQSEELVDKGIALNNAGICSMFLGDYETATQHFERSLAHKQAIGDRRGIALGFTNLGSVAYYQGRFDVAIDAFKRSLQIHREIGNQTGRANMLNNTGVLLRTVGLYAEARRHFDEAITLYEQLGFGSDAMLGTNNLGVLEFQVGRPAAALELCEKGLMIAREKEMLHRQIHALIDLGHIYTALSRPVDAYRAYAEAITLSQDTQQLMLEMEAQAGILGLASVDEREQQERLEAVHAYLVETGTAGMSDPHRATLNAILALQARGDHRSKALLQAAYETLRGQSGKLADAHMRHSFLTDVEVNRTLISLAETHASR
ncbi:MAG: tetratricopeptide repeat protein [Chloroflexota bacterium]